MKTAISLPDETFERASRQARALGMSRSQLFARATERYLDELDARSLTRQIDDALERVNQGLDDSVAEAVAVRREVIAAADDEW